MTWDKLLPGHFGARADAAGVDPNLVWADANGFADFLRPGEARPVSIPVIVELRDDLDVDGASALVQLDRELRDLNAGSVPSIYPRTAYPSITAHCTAYFTAAFCDAVLNDPQRRFGKMIRHFELQMPVVPQRARPIKPAPVRPGSQHPQRARAGKTLIGVIDSGCPFAHRQLRSRHGGGTCVLNIWDQDANPAFASPHGGGTRPMDLGYGCEVPREQLDALIAACTRDGVVAEAACYERAGYGDLRSRFTHGAAVLGLLAGPRTLGARTAQSPKQPPTWRDADDEASRADIVFVQLPRDAVQDSSSAGLPRLILDGLRYILSCASDETQRIVVNISDGSSRGTHDGHSIIEQAMLALRREQPEGRELHIVIAAGNSYDEERHAQFDDLKKGRSDALVLRLQPGSEAPSYVVVRLPPQAEGVHLRVLPPGQEAPAEADVAAGQARAWPASRDAQCAVIYPALKSGSATLALIAFAPTASTQRGRPVATSGNWTIRLECKHAISEPVHLYVARNQLNPGALARGKQAVFVDADGKYDSWRYLQRAKHDAAPPASAIRRLGTLNSLACAPVGCGVWVVASHLLRTGEPALYASAGPAAGGKSRRDGPDVSAPTDGSRALPGIRVMGARSGETVQVTGTSFAVPQVARELVNFGKLPARLDHPVANRNGAGNLPLWLDQATA